MNETKLITHEMNILLIRDAVNEKSVVIKIRCDLFILINLDGMQKYQCLYGIMLK